MKGNVFQDNNFVIPPDFFERPGQMRDRILVIALTVFFPGPRKSNGGFYKALAIRVIARPTDDFANSILNIVWNERLFTVVEYTGVWRDVIHRDQPRWQDFNKIGRGRPSYLSIVGAVTKIANMSKREASSLSKGRILPPALKSMIDGSPIAAVLSDPRQRDNPIVHCNQAFIDLTGYAREEVIGRNCRFLAGPSTEEHLSDEIRQGVRGRIPVLVQIRNYRKDGTPFRNAVLVAPIFDAEGELDYFLGSQSAAPDPELGPSRPDIAKSKVGRLSPRQREVLTAMSLGRLTKQIANDIGVSERTVKLHKAALLKALEVRSVAEAIRIAIESGL